MAANNSQSAVLEATLRHALAWLEGLDQRPVHATAGLEALRRRLDRKPGEEGVAPERVIADLVRDVEGGIFGNAGGRFFGWVIGGTLPSALAADRLTATWDQNAALYSCGPAAAVVEELVGAWLKEIFGLPEGAAFALVSGCQMAHVTCLAAARHALLARCGWDVERRGLVGAPAIRILAGEAHGVIAHGSVARAVRLLGLGTDQVVTFEPADLEASLRSGTPKPTMVLLQAGDINTGAFDSFATLIPIAQRHGAWVHVDGAFGLWAAASDRFLHLLDGMAAADSWATDGHKWLNVPYDCGYAFVDDAQAHRASMSHRADYLTHATEARDQIDWNPEWSRRGRGFATYAALRELGRGGLAALVERCSDHARALVTCIGRLRGVEILAEPIINQGLVRFDGDDRRTEETIAAIVATGEAFFGATTWRGKRAMRVSVCNWRTSEEDVERAVRAVERVRR
ncbi:MAG: pyridoxal-dependent decarboxylase [Bryobacteraceae bacterium]